MQKKEGIKTKYLKAHTVQALKAYEKMICDHVVTKGLHGR